ncbi:MAG TPA: hypothetical protein VF194_15135 [Ferrovibrio sp.]|uniref:hypothetical protein n=1 Tax=Ferrovibrio sp. TaxID=1917215 RepID=UPI002ED3B8B3
MTVLEWIGAGLFLVVGGACALVAVGAAVSCVISEIRIKRMLRDHNDELARR